MTAPGGYTIIDADTGRPVRASRFTAETVVRALYQRLADNPWCDLKILDEGLRPMSAHKVVTRTHLVDAKCGQSVAVRKSGKTPPVAQAAATVLGPTAACPQTTAGTGARTAGPATPTTTA